MLNSSPCEEETCLKVNQDVPLFNFLRLDILPLFIQLILCPQSPYIHQGLFEAQYWPGLSIQQSAVVVIALLEHLVSTI